MSIDVPAMSYSSRRAQWAAVAVTMLAVYLLFLDISVVFIALPTLEHSLGASFSQAEFVVAGYQLAYASCLLCGARLGDKFGCGPVFAWGLIVFAAASALTGLAPNPVVLDIARPLQGLGAGLVYPQMIPVLRAIPNDTDRRRGIAVTTAAMGSGIVTGPVVGGALIATGIGGHNSWRLIFLCNVPLAIVAAVIGRRSLPKGQSEMFERLDVVGLLLLSVAIALVVIPLVEAPDHGVGMLSYASFTLAACLVALFVPWSRYRNSRDRPVLLSWKLLSDKAFVVGTTVTFVLFLGIPSLLFMMTLYMQFGLRFGALRTGLTAVPYALGMIMAAGIATRLLPWLGKSSIFLGCLSLVAGVYWMSRVLLTMGPASNGSRLYLPFLISGLGVGMAGVPLLNIVLASMRHGRSGDAAGILTTCQQLGGVTGVAISGVLLFGLLGATVANVVDSRMPTLRQELVAVGTPAPLVPVVLADYGTCIHDAVGHAKDPAFVPAACRTPDRVPKSVQALIGRISALLTHEGRLVQADGFAKVVSKVLWVNIVAFIVAFACVMGLERPRQEFLMEDPLLSFEPLATSQT